MCLNPRESGEYILANAEHVEVHDEGVVRCSKEVLRRLKSGEISLEALYKKTELHPQQADDKVKQNQFIIRNSFLNIFRT